MNTETVKQQLKELRLYTAASELENVLAQQKKTAHLVWVADMLSREIDARKERALQYRIKQADFPEVTCLENFDWDFDPDIDKEKIMNLATLEFLDHRQIALFLGKPGTGKTHLALAIGVRAAQRGHRVFCSSVKKLIAQIALAKLKNNLDVLFKKILSAKLWILDDWGVISMKSDIAEEIFDLLDRRKHSAAMLLTSNRDVDEWSSVFSDPVLASAALDRIFEQAHIVTFTGPSYRLKGKIVLKDISQKPKNNGGQN